MHFVGVLLWQPFRVAHAVLEQTERLTIDPLERWIGRHREKVLEEIKAPVRAAEREQLLRELREET